MTHFLICQMGFDIVVNIFTKQFLWCLHNRYLPLSPPHICFPCHKDTRFRSRDVTELSPLSPSHSREAFDLSYLYCISLGLPQIWSVLRPSDSNIYISPSYLHLLPPSNLRDSLILLRSFWPELSPFTSIRPQRCTLPFQHPNPPWNLTTPDLWPRSHDIPGWGWLWCVPAEDFCGSKEL